jgi:hypothetical protein
MKQECVTIGMQARVKIGQRLAEVTVLRRLEGRGRARFECRTSDTGRLVKATAARLRPVPPPAVRAMVGRMVAAAAARDEIVLGGIDASALSIEPDVPRELAAWAAEPVGAW